MRTAKPYHLNEPSPCSICPLREWGCPAYHREDRELLICRQMATPETYAHPELQADVEYFFETHQN